MLADYLTKLWGQQVIVLNQPGGAGAVAIKAVAPAAPDGHTLYMSLATNFIALPELQENFPVDVLRDFVPIGYVGDHPMVIAAGRDLGVNTLPELIALAKKRKGELNIACRQPRQHPASDRRMAAQRDRHRRDAGALSVGLRRRSPTSSAAGSMP